MDCFLNLDLPKSSAKITHTRSRFHNFDALICSVRKININFTRPFKFMGHQFHCTITTFSIKIHQNARSS